MLRRTVNNAAWACSTVGLWIAGGLLIYIVLHIILEVILRNFFSRSTGSMGEYVGYAMGTMTYLSIAHTMASRKHVRVSLIKGLLAQRMTVVVELICLAVTFAAFTFIVWYVWKVLERDFLRGSVAPTLMETPTWYIDATIFAGLLIFLLQLISSALDAVFVGVPEDAPEGD